jgi:PIN domain nuclease of toxin-antitoxin system
VIVLDTHVWLWWRAAPEELSTRLRDAIDASRWIGISAMSCFEVARLADDGRITLATDPASWVRRALGGERVELLPVDADVAVTAALLDRRRFPGDPGDRIILASALAHGALLGTKDRRIRSFDRGATIW